MLSFAFRNASVGGTRPCVLKALRKKALAAATSRLGRKSTVLPRASTARAIEVRPSAVDLHVGLIHAPRAADWTCEAIPTLLELGSVVLGPAQNGARRDRDPALGHY